MSQIAFLGAVETGLIFALVAFGVFLSFRILDFPDLTVDGSFPLGAAVSAILIVNGMNPWLATMAAVLADLDVLNNLAERAQTLNYAKPELCDNDNISIKQGRHPVVEQVMKDPFIANPVELNSQRKMLIITGPNMGGKSTYMRQTALIVLMAHIGCYVPADSAKIGNIDRIFTRIGASDDLASGRSTLMVERTETGEGENKVIFSLPLHGGA